MLARPDPPGENPFIETFNGCARSSSTPRSAASCSTPEEFVSLVEAQVLYETTDVSM